MGRGSLWVSGSLGQGQKEVCFWNAFCREQMNLGLERGGRGARKESRQWDLVWLLSYAGCSSFKKQMFCPWTKDSSNAKPVRFLWGAGWLLGLPACFSFNEPGSFPARLLTGGLRRNTELLLWPCTSTWAVACVLTGAALGKIAEQSSNLRNPHSTTST